MARHNLAARSLRHLRFAHRMMVGQPLLARASQGFHTPTSIVLDGHQLQLGRILRRLPLNDAKWTVDGAESVVEASPATSVAAPAETLLRLLPRLPETNDADTTNVIPDDDVGALPATTSLSGQTDAHRVADDAPLTPATSPAVPQARADGVRPRSRIVELPGTVSLPVEELSAEELIAPDIPVESSEDIPVNARTESLADALETTESEPEQQPLMREADQRMTATSREPAKAAVDHVKPVPTAALAPTTPTPRRRGKQPSATPPRASDALFPPTNADRSPVAWLSRLQHAEEPAQPEPPAAPVKPSNEPPSTPAQRPGARGSRKGATKAQASTTATPDTHTSGAATPSTEQAQKSQSAEQPTTLPDSSRTLLHTLTGVDPATVRVYRGPVAERVTSAQNADALTDGGAIALGAGHTTDTPETLGLLAHELTHFAQRRSPRFVPPIIQPPHQQHRANAGISSPMPLGSQPAASPADEEAEATQVEARVTRVARAMVTPPHAMQPALTGESESEAATPPARETPSRPGSSARPVWGNLPAPWEPLPDWMAAPAGPSADTSQPAPQPQPLSSSAPTRPSSANTPGTQRAERGRSLPTEVEEASQAHTQETAAPEPDLDQLAQQVHAILKRRLAAERRRFG